MGSRSDLEFAQPAAASLLREGRLDARWVGAFYALAGTARSDPVAWPPGFFRLQHFVCAYLPLRYAVWARSAGRRNLETEALLAAVIVSVTELLWQGFASAAAASAPAHNQALLSLVLGAENPLRFDGAERAAWGRRYCDEVKAMSPAWRGLSAWPKREAMALHVASFYLPMGIPPARLSNRAGTPASWRRLLEGLRPHVHGDVIELVHEWLAAAEAPRDSAGIPEVGWRTGETSELFGRTLTEGLLIG